MRSVKAISAGVGVLFGLVMGLLGCAPKPSEVPTPASPAPSSQASSSQASFAPGAVRALCATEAGGPVFLLIGRAPTDGEAVEKVQRGLAPDAAPANEPVTLVTLQSDGAVTRSDHVLARETRVAGGAVEQVLHSKDAVAGVLTRSRRSGPAVGLSLGAVAHRCRSAIDLRLAAVSASEVILVRQKGSMSAEVSRTPRAGGPETICAQATLEEGRSSMTLTETCGADRRILYAPASASASESMWRDGVKTSEETLLAAFIVWSTPTRSAPL